MKKRNKKVFVTLSPLSVRSLSTVLKKIALIIVILNIKIKLV